ncbi:MAG: biopolymer transporter ExbD [Deltaproteobacteria bacterium]|nr:MAG: biopolymer transporter ExbD [Deltaproteobacteria bacterium]
MAGVTPRRVQKRGSDLPLIPIMSLFLILVPMLLLTAEFERAAVVDLFLPSSDMAPSESKEKGPSLTLTVAVTPDGLTLIANRKKKVIKAKKSGNEVSYELDKLTDELVKLKKKYPRAGEVVLLIDGEIPYDTIIQVMDACREKILPTGERVTLFPNVALADRVVTKEGKKSGQK